MDACPDENVNHPLNIIHRHPEFPRKQLRILVVSDVDPLKELFAVFPVLRACVHLVHKPVFRSMELCGQIRHLPQKTLDIRKARRRLCHKVVLDLRHTVAGRFHHKVVLAAEVVDQAGFGHLAGIRQLLHPGVFQAVLAKDVEAGLQQLFGPFFISARIDSLHLPLRGNLTDDNLSPLKNSKRRSFVCPLISSINNSITYILAHKTVTLYYFYYVLIQFSIITDNTQIFFCNLA